MALATQSAEAARQLAGLRHTGAVAERCRRSLAYFIRHLWHVLEPDTELVWSRHMDLVCAKLEAVSRGEIRRLVINIPPGTMKSLTVSVFWQAWEWLTRPGLRGIYTSNSDDLVKRDSDRTRQLLESPEYREILEALCRGQGRSAWTFSGSQNEKHWFANSAQGFRQCFTIRSKFTGKRGDRIVIDDPHDVGELIGSVDQVTKRMDEVKTIVKTKLMSRVNDKRTATYVIIMQRVHLGDVAGWALENGWDSLILPMEFEPERADPLDWRTEPGELLDPVRFPREVIDEDKSQNYTPAAWSALYQQHPVPAEGGLYKREHWVVLPRSQFPAKYDRVGIWVDLAFKGKATSDFCAMVVLGRVGAMFYVLDLVHLRMDYGEQRAAFRALVERWPQAGPKGVEDKANGSAMIDDLRREIPGLLALDVPAGNGKEVRAQAWAYVQRARQIVIPEEAPWREVVIGEHEAFPNGLNDDIVDALGHGVIWELAHPIKKTKVDLSPGSLGGASPWRS